MSSDDRVISNGHTEPLKYGVLPPSKFYSNSQFNTQYKGVFWVKIFTSYKMKYYALSRFQRKALVIAMSHIRGLQLALGRTCFCEATLSLKLVMFNTVR